jgi:hypothetical protein
MKPRDRMVRSTVPIFETVKTWPFDTLTRWNLTKKVVVHSARSRSQLAHWPSAIPRV